MNNQFVQKVIEMSCRFDATPSAAETKEWVEGEYKWLLRKRILDDEFVEYYVSRVSLTEAWRRERAFVTPSDDEGEWKIEIVN
jgi:hypothetical protein